MPNYPKLNSLAEISGRIAKALISKTQMSRTEQELALLEYKNTPMDGYASPAQLLMGRNLHTLLPYMFQYLSPVTVDHEDFLKPSYPTSQSKKML